MHLNRCASRLQTLDALHFLSKSPWKEKVLKEKFAINPDSRQVFNPDGAFVREIGGGGKGGGGKGGRYGGLCCDSNGFLMATRTEKGRSFIQVFR